MHSHVLASLLSDAGTCCWTDWYGECVGGSSGYAKQILVGWVGEEEERKGKRRVGVYVSVSNPK